ncbi:MAG: DUF115 domain-containing protein [Candidatus Lokiarchaeota archaeon]|nr:DUF115 domain-containing protein [Candidatus Lokiarchaeota archaeon]
MTEKNNIALKIGFYQEFQNIYRNIAEIFDFNPKKDKAAKIRLSEILSEKGANWDIDDILILFQNLITKKKNIFIFGCGPSLEISINTIIRDLGKNFFKTSVNLVADGASVLLKQLQIPIDGLFTDLDGIGHNEFNYTKFIIVHAHGDNLKKLEFFKDDIINFNNLIATTQIEPSKNIINAGGFTDGDRILYFIRNLILPSQNIFLFGMDFGKIVGRFSKPQLDSNENASMIKKKKLEFSVKLLEYLLKNFSNKIYFVNSDKISKHFSYLTLKDFKKEFKS